MSVLKNVFCIALVVLGWYTVGTREASAAPVAGGFRVATRWHLGGAGGWGKMLLDPRTKHLFIPRSDRVDIIDTSTGKVSGQVRGFVGAHDIALDEKGMFGYVSDLTDGTEGFVRVFDRATLQILTSIPVGRTPDRIAFDALTNKVFVFDGSAHNATVIDGATNKTVETIILPARPGSVVSDGNGSIFVAIRSLSQILRIDASNQKVAVAWSLAPCEGPSGMTMDRTRRQIFATCENQKLIAVDAVKGVASFISAIPQGADDVSFDSEHHLLFVLNGAGALTIFRASLLNKFIEQQELTALPNAQALAVDAINGAAYVATAKFGQRTGAVSEELRYRPTPVQESFTILVVANRSKPRSLSTASK